MKRREALAIGGAFAIALAIPPILRRRGGAFEFEPHPTYPQFRQLRGGFTATSDPIFAGLTQHDHAQPDAPICQEVFGTIDPTDTRTPIAVFSDVNCPYCRVLETNLQHLEDQGLPIKLIYNQLPLLGERSVYAARLSIAAKWQNAPNAVHLELMQQPLRPGPSAVQALADRHGLNGDALWRDMRSARMDRSISQAFGLGERLGIPGTPGTLLGRTLVIGVMSDARLRALIEIEQAEPARVCA